MRLRFAALALVSTGALAAGLLVAPTATAGLQPRARVPMPTVKPIPGDQIFTGALQDLAALGYTEREYVVNVSSPKVYSYIGSSTKVRSRPAPRSPQRQYRSRIIVRAPEDPSAFNGRVLVEMMNTTTMVDLDVAWEQAHEYLIREGWAYVGITVQQTGINALQRFTRQPKRYTRLGLNLMTPQAAKDSLNGQRDPSIAWDLTTQVGALLQSGAAESPLSGYDVESLLLTGQSQMGAYAVTYASAIQPLYRVYDGILVAYRGSGATNLRYAKAVSGVVPSTSKSVRQRTIKAGGAPVISLQSESDPLRGPGPDEVDGVARSLWRADSDADNDRFRLWEVAGSSHNDRWGSEQALGILSRDYGLPFVPACPWTAPEGVNNFPMRFAWHSALESLAIWAESGPPAPNAPRLERDSLGVIQRDADGNALGGIRLPRIEVPIAKYTPTTEGPLFCPLTGTQSPFAADDLASRYPTIDDYVAQVQSRVDASVAEGFLLTEDGVALVESARQGPAAEAETIQKY